eukprot:TRINITY_DN22635_c0_g1_i1.p1 TRINITY_DN22635_c0_g1~~TRINITY_DN22635_c0_g1_i1.p1  ORF type:complete len:273 (-),score=66.62 TRINITY_DN22635_c0_g1_i1:347-1165(-)
MAVGHTRKGPRQSASTACATGAHSIADALRFIQLGHAERVLCGAAEAPITPVSLAGFCRARALSTKFNDEPARASRPFDAARDGFVMGEGAACLLLEEYELAKARGARIYAEVLGAGISADAHHLTAPSPEGEGAARAMRAALLDAGVSPGQVAYVNAHATSTPLGDALEAEAVRSVFGTDPSAGPRVSSTKGHVGHLLGAAGAVEAVLTVLAVYKDVMPATCNLDSPNVGPLRHVVGPQEAAPVHFAMSNSFGFGGVNASLVFGKSPDEPR